MKTERCLEQARPVRRAVAVLLSALLTVILPLSFASADGAKKGKREKVIVQIDPGEEREIALTLKSKKDVKNAKLVLSKKLQPFFEYSLDRVNLERGKNEVKLIVTVPVGVDSPSKVRGWLLVRKKGKTITKRIRMVLEIGEVKELGDDDDEDGLWDDVQDSVDVIYESEPNILLIQSRGAQALQLLLTSGQNNDLVAANAARRETSKWMSCLAEAQRLGVIPTNEAMQKLAELKALTLTTDERVAAYRSSEELLAGETVSIRPIPYSECTS